MEGFGSNNKAIRGDTIWEDRLFELDTQLHLVHWNPFVEAKVNDPKYSFPVTSAYCKTVLHIDSVLSLRA